MKFEVSQKYCVNKFLEYSVVVIPTGDEIHLLYLPKTIIVSDDIQHLTSPHSLMIKQFHLIVHLHLSWGKFYLMLISLGAWVLVVVVLLENLHTRTAWACTELVSCRHADCLNLSHFETDSVVRLIIDDDENVYILQPDRKRRGVRQFWLLCQCYFNKYPQLRLILPSVKTGGS